MTSPIDKVSKLLAQSDRTDNVHERDTFLKAAQRLATTHSIDLAAARQHTAKREAVEEPTTKWVDIGEKGSTDLKPLAELIRVIGLSNDVSWEHHGSMSRLLLFGFPSDIDMTWVMFQHLSLQMLAGAADFTNSDAWHGESYQGKAMTALTARRSYCQSFTDRVGERLAAARDEARLAAECDRSETALVLVDKKRRLRSFYDSDGTTKRVAQTNSGLHSRTGTRLGARAGETVKLRSDKPVSGGRTAIER